LFSQFSGSPAVALRHGFNDTAQRGAAGSGKTEEILKKRIAELHRNFSSPINFQRTIAVHSP
jgi:superfamily I DNA and RNA helicase